MPDVIYKLVLETDKFKEQWTQIRAAGKDFADIIGNTQDEIDSASKQFKDGLSGIETAFDSLKKEAETTSIGMVQGIKLVIESYEKYRALLTQQGGLTGAAGELLPRQLTGIQSSTKAFKDSMLADMPFGGLIGLMLLGGKREEDLRASSTQAMRIFQESGQVGDEYLTKLSGRIRDLSKDLGKGGTPGAAIAAMAQDFQSAGAGFAQAGVNIENVIDKNFRHPIGNAKRSVLEATVAMDNLFKQAAGTNAKAAGELVKNFGIESEKAANEVLNIGAAARTTDTSVSALMGTFMSLSASLRVMKVDVGEVRDAYWKFAEITRERMGVKAGQESPYAAEYARNAIQQIGQGLSGMSVGMAAVLGERMPQVFGRQVTGLEASYAVREGLSGKGQTKEGEGIFAQSILTLGKLAMESTSNEAEQRTFIEKLMPGISLEGSKAILDLTKDVKDRQIPINEAMKKHQEQLNKSFDGAAKEQSNLLKSMLHIQDGIAKIGAGILSAAVTGFQLIAATVRWAYFAWKNDERADVELKYIEALGKRSDIAVGAAMSGMKDVFKGIEGGGGTLLSTLSTPVDRDEIARRMGKKFVSVGGHEMLEGQAKNIVEEAQHKEKATSKAQFSEWLEMAGIRGGRQGAGPRGAGSYTMGDPLYYELMGAYEKGGGGQVEETLAKLKKEGKIKPGTRLWGKMGYEAEKTGGMATMEVEGETYAVRDIKITGAQVVVEKASGAKQVEP